MLTRAINDKIPFGWVTADDTLDDPEIWKWLESLQKGYVIQTGQINR